MPPKCPPIPYVVHYFSLGLWSEVVHYIGNKVSFQTQLAFGYLCDVLLLMSSIKSSGSSVKFLVPHFLSRRKSWWLVGV